MKLNYARLQRWSGLGLGWAFAVAILLVVFVPEHRRAGRESAAAEQAAGELAMRVSRLTRLPERKQRLDSLVKELNEFQAGLVHTDQVDRAMRAFADRAGAADVDCWILNPSIPTLVTLDEAADSIAALSLAVLPVEFECQGRYVAVGKFLEEEERRPEFGRWEQLTIMPGPGPAEVRAHGVVRIFLLPVSATETGAA